MKLDQTTAQNIARENTGRVIHFTPSEEHLANNEFFLLHTQPFTAYGKDDNELLAVNMHFIEGENGDDVRQIVRKSCLEDMKDDYKTHTGREPDTVNWDYLEI